MNDFEIIYSDDLDLHVKRLIFEGLDDYAVSKTGKTSDMQQFSLAVYDEDRPVAGLIGITFWKTIQIDQLFVNKTYRKHGLGKALMEKAMDIGKEKGYLMCTVETMDFQAIDFYKKFGFNVDFARDGYEDNRTLYFFSKQIG